MKKGLLIGGILLVVCLGIYFLDPPDPDKDPWAKFNHFEDNTLGQNVEAYFDATMGYETESDQVFDVYTEMSKDFGYMAYKMPNNNEFAGDVFMKLGKINHYMIEQSGVIDGGVVKSKEAIMDKLIDPAAYKSTGVDIEKGLTQLVERNRPALLITDFEQWNKIKNIEYYKEAIFLKPFKDWLSKPNHTITFIYSDFCDQNTNKEGRKGKGSDIMPDRFHKKIFFAFFDVDKQRSFSKAAIPVNIPGSFQTMTIDIAPYSISTNYKSADKSGISMGLDKQVTEVRCVSNKNFEFMNVGKYNWEYIDKVIQTKKREAFLNNLYLDASNNTAFDLQSIKVNVYDVTADFVYFTRCNFAKKLKPKTRLDKKTGKMVFDPKTENIDIAKKVYDPETKTLIKHWIYKHDTDSYSTFTEFFDINNLLFKNTKARSSKKISVEVMMHSAYNPAKMTCKNGLLRVDIIADKVKKNLSSFDCLTWDSPGNSGGPIQYKNVSLSKSLKEAVNSQNSGQVIYTYYIRVLPSSK
jgi:hypothetical protein